MNQFAKRFKTTIKYQVHRVSALQFLILVVVIVGTISAVKYFGKVGEWRIIRVQVVGKNWINSYTSYDGYRPPYWLAEHVHVGDQERGISGSTTAIVKRIETYSRSSSDFDMYLTLSVNGILNKKTGTFSYNGKPVMVGAPFELRLSGTQILSQIIEDNFPSGGYPKKQISTSIRLRNAEPWILAGLTIGDTMTNGPEGESIATITNIKTEPAQGSLVFTDSSARSGKASTGSIIIEQNSRLRDLIITATLQIEKHNDEWYFGGHQNVKTGNLIWLYLPKVNIKGAEIESVSDLPPNEAKP